MNRREFISNMFYAGIFSSLGKGLFILSSFAESKTGKHDRITSMKREIEKLVLSDQEWRERLTEDQYDVLRREGTEKPFSSELNEEKREGIYHCVGCDLELFSSDMKFDSGTGWPSFFTTMEGAFETKVDYKLFYSRTEYHCARCGGHHGHVFKDGPPPTGQRWCNNGIALRFVEGKV